MTVPSWAEIDWKTRRVANVEYVNQRLKNVPIKPFDLVEFNDGQYSVFEDYTFDMLFETTLSEAEQKQVASVEYLLKSVDRVTKVLNGQSVTVLGPDGEYHPMYELNYNREDYNSVPCVWGGGAC